MTLLRTMVAPHTRQATASEAVGVDLSVDSLGWHRMVADAQAESSVNVCNSTVGTEQFWHPCAGLAVAGN
jgi:hypothetical protein